jgi:hypothetical protein
MGALKYVSLLDWEQSNPLEQELIADGLSTGRRTSEEEAVRCTALPSPCQMLGGKIKRILQTPSNEHNTSNMVFGHENIVERGPHF